LQPPATFALDYADLVFARLAEKRSGAGRVTVHTYSKPESDPAVQQALPGRYLRSRFRKRDGVDQSWDEPSRQNSG